MATAQIISLKFELDMLRTVNNTMNEQPKLMAKGEPAQVNYIGVEPQRSLNKLLMESNAYNVLPGKQRLA